MRQTIKAAGRISKPVLLKVVMFPAQAVLHATVNPVVEPPFVANYKGT